MRITKYQMSAYIDSKYIASYCNAQNLGRVLSAFAGDINCAYHNYIMLL